MEIVVETYRNPGEPSSNSVRVRPLPGQGVSVGMKVSCSTAMRTQHPVGTRFLLDVREMQRGSGAPFLYAPPTAAYKVLKDKEVERLFSKVSTTRPKVERAAPAPKAPEAMTLEAIEGLMAEGRLLRRSRNDALRRTVLQASKGVCAACDTDFAQRLGELGWSLLQVHHIEKLSERIDASVTKAEDLAVLCANCHALIHADKAKPKSLKRLRALLARADGDT